jgi:regulator of replication initiation timing
MTYDSWKTTDPRDYLPEPEEEPSELETVYEKLKEVEEIAKHDAQVAASRIKELTAALEEALEYFKDNYDVVDGSYGEPSPNKEMCLGQMIDEALHGIRF